MTAEVQKKTNIMLRNDTILGVCEAIGEDLGINANLLRIAFCIPMFWNPLAVIGAYLALGILVAATRFAFPDKVAHVGEPAAKPALVEVAKPAAEQEEERELIAA